jgi:hypothetical protein
MMRAQKRHLRIILDAFGNHSEIQAFRHADDCSCDRGIVSLDCDISNKRTVDLELAHTVLPQVAEAGIACSEIVNCQRYSYSSQFLPKRSGTDVLRALKENIRTADIPVIVCSGIYEKNAEKLLLEGACAFVEKNALLDDVDPLLEKIKAALQTRALLES